MGTNTYNSKKGALSKMAIEKALGRLAELLQENKERVELVTAGGVISVLQFGNREMTQDIDAIFPPKQKQILTMLINQVSKEQNLPSGEHAWLNDGVSFFGLQTKSNNVIFRHSHLVLYTANWYENWYELLGMKLSGAWRRDADFDDAIQILRQIGPEGKIEILKESIKYKNLSPYIDDETFTNRFNRTWKDAFCK